jgi:hypothetical protein
VCIVLLLEFAFGSSRDAGSTVYARPLLGDLIVGTRDVGEEHKLCKTVH